MNIVCHYSNDPPFLPDTHETKGLGGTENFACYVARELMRSGHSVKFFNRQDIEPTDIEGIRWANLEHFNPDDEIDILISFRMRDVFQTPINAKLRVLILADTESHGLGDDVRTGRITTVMPVGKWQMDKIAQEENLVNHNCWMPASNGVDLSEFELIEFEKKPGMCIHLSTPERALGLLLDVWPEIEDAEILKSKGIKPELHLFSSFLGWGTSQEDNESMSSDQYTWIETLIAKGYNIINHKHVPKPEMRNYQLQSDLFLYPTTFNETYCISLVETMAAGVIPVVSNRAALAERVIDGVNGFLVGDKDHDAYTDEAKQLYISKVVTALWLDEAKKKHIREAAMQKAGEHDYAKLIPAWLRKWETRIEKITVPLYEPSVEIETPIELEPEPDFGKKNLSEWYMRGQSATIVKRDDDPTIFAVSQDKQHYVGIPSMSWMEVLDFNPEEHLEIVDAAYFDSMEYMGVIQKQ